MNNQSVEKKYGPRSSVNHKGFSLRRGVKFFLKANILLILLTLIFIVNETEWQYDGRTSVEMFVVFAEPFIILLSILVAIRPNINSKGKSNKRESLKERMGALIAFVSLSLFSLLFWVQIFRIQAH